MCHYGLLRKFYTGPEPGPREIFKSHSVQMLGGKNATK